MFSISSDTTQLIMKAVMHELDYDLDDDDLEFLYQLNQSAKKKRKKSTRIDFLYDGLFFF